MSLAGLDKIYESVRMIDEKYKETYDAEYIKYLDSHKKNNKFPPIPQQMWLESQNKDKKCNQ